MSIYDIVIAGDDEKNKPAAAELTPVWSQMSVADKKSIYISYGSMFVGMLIGGLATRRRRFGAFPGMAAGAVVGYTGGAFYASKKYPHVKR